MKAAMLVFLIGVPMVAAAQTENFDSTAKGAFPSGWKAGVTGQGSNHWTVNPDSSAPSAPNVLTQDAKGTFPWVVKEGVSITDGFVEVKFKSISGKEDQAGGVMWRWKDGNFYILCLSEKS